MLWSIFNLLKYYIFLGDHVLEYGAHWIHGEEGNVVFDWASKNRFVEEGDQNLTQTGKHQH